RQHGPAVDAWIREASGFSNKNKKKRSPPGLFESRHSHREACGRGGKIMSFVHPFQAFVQLPAIVALLTAMVQYSPIFLIVRELVPPTWPIGSPQVTTMVSPR